MIHRTNEQHAEYHMRRTAKMPKAPGPAVEFFNGTEIVTGEFWAFAPSGLWLTSNGQYVNVCKARKHSDAARAGATWSVR